MFRKYAAANEVSNLMLKIAIAEEPVFFCIAVSTKRLCEIRHIIASIVISLIVSGSVLIIAIGPYKGRNMLEIKTTADSPGRPIILKAGARTTAIFAITPQYCRRLTPKLMGSIIFRSHQIVFPAFGSAFLVLLISRFDIVFIEYGY
jgi:hypothetical protein